MRFSRFFSSFHLSSRTRVELGMSGDGATILRNRSDPYLHSLQPRELSARVKRSVSVDEFVDIQARSVLSWDKSDVEHVGRLVERMRDVMEREFPNIIPMLPEDVRVYVTSGQEETGLTEGPKSRIAYCRGMSNIFFSRECLRWDNESTHQLARHLLWHEMWHIISRSLTQSNLDLVYRVFGFERMHPAPPDLRLAQRISNPDAMYLHHGIRLSPQAKVLHVPILFLDPSYDVSSPDDSLFNHMVVLFAQCDVSSTTPSWIRRPNTSSPLLQDILSMLPNNNTTTTFTSNDDNKYASSLFDLIGRNTHYLLHVEEVVAENFAMMAQRSQSAPDQNKLNQLRSSLQSLN